MSLHDTESLVAEFGAGRMVVLMDDHERENEGDLVMAACQVKAGHINFMSRHGRGLICLALTPEDCERLRLPLMSNRGFSCHGTNFTASIDAGTGVTTGISAADRAHTVRTAVAPDTGPADLVRPGHVFPLMAHPGGVLVRAGHTEAGCDLARLARLHPAAVIVEILNEDGSMARRPQLEQFAEQHSLQLGTIADLISYRMQNEKTVQRLCEQAVHTEFGDFRLLVYKDLIHTGIHYALVAGELEPARPVLVRVHLHDPVLDLTGLVKGHNIQRTLLRIGREGGVAVVLCDPLEPEEVVARVESLGSGGTMEHPHDLRTIGIGAQILVDIGVQKMRVLSSPRRMHALAGFGLEIVEFVEPECT